MSKLGNMRPSQLIYTFGVGSLMDLPNMSVLVMGLDDWNQKLCREISEERLLAALQKKLGPQLKKLCLPPVSMEESSTAPTVGVPTAAFPRWMRCPLCHTLATIDSGVFNLRNNPYRPDRIGYVHANCNMGKEPNALPVRFLLACRAGHLTDFPWIEYVHGGKPICKPASLTLREYGASGDASDIVVECKSCGTQRRMGDAFDREKFKVKCSGHHPHLRKFDEKVCTEEVRTILLGSSNSWFPSVMSALSIPCATDPLPLLVEEQWKYLKDVPSLEVAKFITAPSRMPVFSEYDAEEIWKAIEAKRQGSANADESPVDLKEAEWQILIRPKAPLPTKDFQMRLVDPPKGYETYFESTVLLERIREVRVLTGFTRIESNGDFTDVEHSDDKRETPLSRKTLDWLPASEVRGEGIFLRLKEEALQAWEKSLAVRELEKEFLAAHCMWRKLRKMNPPEEGFPGMRYVLIHSLSHALMRQISLECGYSAASVRERLYCRSAGQDQDPMAGILIYTAASDSEGTLGGLVNLGDPVSMGRHMEQLIESMRICGSDPLCAEHTATGEGRGIHGASCHGCLFSAETSCERGNRYLDRNTLVATFAAKGVEFFKGES